MESDLDLFARAICNCLTYEHRFGRGREDLMLIWPEGKRVRVSVHDGLPHLTNTSRTAIRRRLGLDES